MKEIQISHEIPLIYEMLNSRFGASWNDGLLIAYSGKIYCKDNPDPSKVIHEKVHLDHQAEIGNDVWWRCFLDDDSFRLKEEKLAYKAEADFIKKYIKNREVRFKMIDELADNLSSELYGNIIGKRDALSFLMK